MCHVRAWRIRCRRFVLISLTSCSAWAAILAGPLTPAWSLITPARVLIGPSASILGVGNAAMAPDGTGGVVWRQLSGGAPHIFVSRFNDGTWSAPMQVDAGQPGPATFPVIAAGDGGRLLVVWVQPWTSESVGGQPPKTHYQLMSALLQPGTGGFGPAMQVDPEDVGDGSGVYPQLAMAPDGNAYVVYRAVTNPLSPNEPQPPGTIAPMRPGDELVDVRVAQFNGLFWSSLGAVNRLPGQVTMRKPTASKAPQIAADRAGDAIVVWQEPSIDGFARIWARRMFGTTQGVVLPVSPEKLDGHPVSVDADAPSLSFSDYAGAKVGFRVAGGAGSPLGTPHVMVNTLRSGLADDAVNFTGAVAIGGASTVGAPSVALDDNGDFQAGFTASAQTQLVRGNETSAGAPLGLGPAAGDPALATMDPDGGGAQIWPGVGSGGRSVVQMRQTLPDGGMQTAALSAPTSGPVSSMTIGPSGQGDALIAFEQGLSTTAQLAVATVQAPPHSFFAFTPVGWARRRGANIGWNPALNVIGSVTYAVLVDGAVRVSDLRGVHYHLPARGLRDGIHQLQVRATDSAGEETTSPAAKLKIDSNPPLVSARSLGGHRVRVRIRDEGSGARARSTSIEFGDGSGVRGELSAVHRYRTRGRRLITVSCGDKAGNRAVDHLWVQVR